MSELSDITAERNAKILVDYYGSEEVGALSVETISKNYGMHISTIRKIVNQDALSNGKRARCKAPKDPRFLDDKRPLTSIHARIGLRIGAYMAEHELTPSAFGMKVNQSRVQVRNMQIGARDLTLMEIIRLGEVLNIPYEELVLGRKGETLSGRS